MKNKEKIIKDFKKKLDILKAHNKSYFEEDNPKISDHEYDKIKKDIIDLSKKHNFLKDLNFIGADVVEVSPPFDVNNMTSLVGATIAFEILCTMTKTN